MILIVLCLVLAMPAVASADIYMWRGVDGVKHYTNSKALVPQEAAASVVLEEEVKPAGEPSVASAPTVDEKPQEPARQAQIIYNQDALADAYAEGWRRGLESIGAMRGNAPVNVQINGPFVAAANGGGGGPDPSWLDYNYPALVTTSFDRGRSRHLTLRMLMQDQFAIDREGPYLIVDRFPPLGPNLNTILPRGLPFFVRPGSRFVNRVITN